MRPSPTAVNRLLVLLTLAFLLTGCGSSDSDSAAKSDAGNLMSSEATAPVPASSPTSASADYARSESKASGGAMEVAPPAKSNGIERKIIYTADVSLVVDKLNPAQQKLLALVRRFKGYVAESNIGGQSGEPRTATWKVRVPVAGYANFLDAVSKIGEVQTVSSSSQDVSAEYYDIDARLRNKRVEEKRLLEHLNRSTAKLSDILLVEKEISRVRGEIEQMTGRLRVLANLSSLTTISITIHEIKDYVPPAPPTFSTEMMRTLQATLGGMVDFGKGIVLFVIATAPWLVLLLLVALPLARWLRRPCRFTFPRKASTPAPPEDAISKE